MPILFCNDIENFSWYSKNYGQADESIMIHFFDLKTIQYVNSIFKPKDDQIYSKNLSMPTDHYCKCNNLDSSIIYKKLLAVYNNCNETDIVINFNKYGKPIALNKNNLALHRQCNLSKSHEALIIAVGYSNDLGIDIEKMIKREYDDIIYSLFHQEEFFKIKQSQNEILEFYKIWTRKEALLKCCGCGLIDDLAAINVARDCNNILLQNFKSDKYYAHNFLIEERYVGCVAYASKIPKEIKFIKHTKASLPF